MRLSLGCENQKSILIKKIPYDMEQPPFTTAAVLVYSLFLSTSAGVIFLSLPTRIVFTMR